MTATNAKQKDGGWKRPEECQGNDGQGNKPENAFFHSLDKHSPDFVSFPVNGGLPANSLSVKSVPQK